MTTNHTKKARHAMVEHQIAARGVTSPRVLNAMRRVPATARRV
ncbi:MAG: hypothetical protein V3R71_09345 [Gemmatimonadales bacterium]